MKALLFALLFSLLAAVSAPAQSASTNRTAPHPPAKPNPNGITMDDLKELSLARKAAFKADPELAKEEAELQQKMRDYQHKVDQAILQADPSLAPIVARLESSPVPRLPMLPPASRTGVSPPPSPPSPASVTGSGH